MRKRRRYGHVHRRIGIDYLTSLPYPVVAVESSEFSVASVSGATVDRTLEEIVFGASLIDATLRDILQQYEEYPPEGIDFIQAVLLAGELRVLLKTYENGEPEGVEFSQAVLTAGELRQILLQYQNYPTEGTQFSQAVLLSGSLT